MACFVGSCNNTKSFSRETHPQVFTTLSPNPGVYKLDSLSGSVGDGPLSWSRKAVLKSLLTSACSAGRAIFWDVQIAGFLKTQTTPRRKKRELRSRSCLFQGHLTHMMSTVPDLLWCWNVLTCCLRVGVILGLWFLVLVCMAPTAMNKHSNGQRQFWCDWQ